MARSRQGTFRAPETTVPRQGTFRLPDSDPETTESESEYKDAEEGPSRARTHISSSSPEPDTEEGPSGARTHHRSTGRGITLYRTIRFKERTQCIGPSEFTGPRESVNVIPNWEECITGNY